jgi:hypothetical protein
MSDPASTAIRRARPEDAAAIASLFRLVYAHSSHPCQEDAFVASTLGSPEVNAWHVADLDGRLIGCMGLLRHAWNRSWELVRGLIHPDFRGGGLARRLTQHAVDGGWNSGECDLIVGFPRNHAMAHIMSEGLQPPFRVVGHDGGINIAGGRREYHLVAVSLANDDRFEHGVPGSSSIATSSFVQSAIMAPLGLQSCSRSYPATLVAGDYARHPDYGPFTFDYHPFCPSDSLEITAYTGNKTDPVAIATDLVRTLDSFAYVRHVRLAVLVDKTAFCSALQSAGFAITAYLPGWHLQSGERFDCVLLTRRSTTDEPTDHGTRNLIDYFTQGYAGVVSPPAPGI